MLLGRWSIKNTIITDINLGSVKFSEDGRSIEFELLDMNRGELYGKLNCRNVYFFEYQNTFEDDDSFACYICEIYSFTLNANKANTQLSDKKFRFYKSNNKLALPNIKIENVVLESGEVFIELYCEAFELILH